MLCACRQASKREASARAQALKEKEKADQARFKEKRKEERAHKKEQAKRMQQERQQAGTGGGKTNVGIFGFLSKPKKEEKKEEGEKSVTPESQAVGDPAIAAGPSFAGEVLKNSIHLQRRGSASRKYQRFTCIT